MFNKELFSVKGISKLKNKIPKTNLGSSKLNKNLLIGSPFNVDKIVYHLHRRSVNAHSWTKNCFGKLQKLQQ